MRLNDIRDNSGARRNRKRVGRGAGSGMGKTSGAGHKGQKSRSGVSINGFEGGQMPIHRRLPKRGFNNIFRKRYDIVNIGLLQEAIDAKRLDAKKPINAESLQAAGLIGKPRDGVRLLGNGEISAKINIEVAGASAGALAAVEKAGGSVTVLAPKKAEVDPEKAARRAEKAAAKKDARKAAAAAEEDDAPGEEPAKKEAAKEAAPGEAPKDEAPKEEAPKEEAPKEEAPKEEAKSSEQNADADAGEGSGEGGETG